MTRYMFALCQQKSSCASSDDHAGLLYCCSTFRPPIHGGPATTSHSSEAKLLSVRESPAKIAADAKWSPGVPKKPDAEEMSCRPMSGR